MQDLKVIRGNIFRSSCQTIVNTINCVGVMGAGLAFECRLRYPALFEQYSILCRDGKLSPGVLWIYKAKDRWVLNFPTKADWRRPSKPEYLHQGLQKFMQTYRSKGIDSIAFPLLGTQHGGLDQNLVLDLMRSYLSHCTIPVEIYLHDPLATDELYEAFKDAMLSSPMEALRAETGLRMDAIERLQAALLNPKIRQINQLLKVPRIGEKTLEKCFAFASAVGAGDSAAGGQQQALFGD